MGRPINPQVALYLDDDTIAKIGAIAVKTGLTRQHVMRSAIALMLEEYEWKRERTPDGKGNVHRLVKRKRSS